MTFIKRTALALTLFCFSTLLVSAQSQTPTIEVTTDSHRAQFTVQGEAQEVRVEVFAPSGEMVFASGTVTGGQVIAWKMRDEKGERVADGAYLATIQFKTASGQTRKRIEQIIVSRRMQEEAPNAPEATITGSGTADKIAKFTASAAIANSIITEKSEKIGIGTTVAPTARLQVNGAQPAASANNGTAATTLLQTSGGKGGKTTGTGKTAGRGASISLVAGNGGDAGASGINGTGGSITLQPGSTGTGGRGGAAGNVLLAPMDGKVGIGTDLPSGTLSVSSELPVALYVSNFSGATSVRSISVGSTGISLYGLNLGGGYAGFFDGQVQINGDASIPSDTLSFGNNARQMLNLFDTRYAIGVQSGTLYYRTNGGFAWFKGGTHNDAQNNPGGGTVLMRLDSAGNLHTNGAVNPSSDRHLKANFSTVNPRSVLARLASIPIQTWNYKSEPESVRHIGAMAQDFRAAFNLGMDDKHISTVDADGVTMAAIQGLYQMMREKDKQIARLQAQVTQLQRTARKKRARQ